MVTENELITPPYAEVNALVLTSCFGAWWEAYGADGLAMLSMPEPNPFGIVNVMVPRDGGKRLEASAARWDGWDELLEQWQHVI